MSVPDWLDSAAGFATCSILQSAGGALIGTGVATIAAGGSGVVPLTLGGLSFLAAGAACQPTAVDTTNPIPQVDGCWSMSEGGLAWLQFKSNTSGGLWVDAAFNPYVDADKTISIIDASWRDEGNGTYSTFIKYNTTNGVREYRQFGISSPPTDVFWRLRPLVGTCDSTDQDPLPYPPDIHNPIPYTDPTTNCTYNVSFQGFASDTSGGEPSPVFKIEAAPPAVRASGGIVGGCDFSPIIYQAPPGGGGPPRIGPWDPTWPDWDGGGTPPWLPFLTTIAAPFVPYIIDQIVDQVFKTPVPQYQYTMRAACNYKQDGSYETYTITLPEQPWETRVLAMQEMNIDFLQQHLLWKTPTCSGGGVGIAGDPVTVNFVSDERSLDGADFLRKRFVYFDQTGTPLEDHVTHWKDFVWEAGPACVSFEGTPMGKPQVWASTVDEAKRVITHAAAIAGVDVADGQWMTGTSRSTRYGKPGTMRVARFSNGNYTVTKRSGPSGNPEACG
jgi:hypothetical protein